MTRHPAQDAPRPAVAVLGSTNMDLVAYVARAPRRGETVAGRSFRTVPGGKGTNQAVAAARAGGLVTLVGAVGDDDFGPRLRAALAEAGVDTQGLRTVPGPSGTAHIVVDDEGGNAIVVVPGANGTVTGLAPGDAERLGSARALLMQLELPLAGVVAGARAARARGVRTVLTPAPVPEEPLPRELLALTDLLVPNEHEAAALTGHDDPRRAARALLEHVPEVVVTLGEAGSLHVSREAPEPVAVPAHRVHAVDTTAAGDAFVGALAVAAFGEGRPMREAMAWASAAAALCVQRPGASSAMPSREEIDALHDTQQDTHQQKQEA
ncbi:ribokinase [Streptomyces sp. 4N509B]|uniref:ribokinase n=1 Tax=Streptomyces sp. 4N509B TaxID=3457413 RepID=UPI003FCFF35C